MGNCTHPKCQLFDLGQHTPITSCQLLQFSDACAATRTAIAKAFAPVAAMYAYLAGIDTQEGPQ